MLRITNISVSDRAAEVLDRPWVTFRPQEPGDVFALGYMSSFTEADGTTVDGFGPRYTACSLAPDGLTNVWLIAPPAGAPQFYFMPKFDWSADEHYHVDLASEAFETFSIGPAKADV